jgi:hypothetical protein
VSLSVLGVFYRNKEDLFWELSVVGLLQEQAMDSKPGWENPSDIVLLKEYAIKALVKSFLPKGNSYQRNRLPGLLKVLVKILNVGEISEDIKSRCFSAIPCSIC